MNAGLNNNDVGGSGVSRWSRLAAGFCVGALVLGAVILSAVGMMASHSESLAKKAYLAKLQEAFERADLPIDKAALMHLRACVNAGQKGSVGGLAIDDAEKGCVGDSISQAILSGGVDKGREVSLRYERLGFGLGIDNAVKKELGLQVAGGG